jgi:hypothetical protein
MPGSKLHFWPFLTGKLIMIPLDDNSDDLSFVEEIRIGLGDALGPGYEADIIETLGESTTSKQISAYIQVRDVPRILGWFYEHSEKVQYVDSGWITSSCTKESITSIFSGKELALIKSSGSDESCPLVALVSVQDQKKNPTHTKKAIFG